MTAPQQRARRPKATQQPYHWFKGESVRQLYDWLGVAGPDTARLEVRQDGDKMTFRVVVSEDESGVQKRMGDGADINNSFLCPPRCP